MAFDINEIGITLEPSEDLSADQFKFVTLGYVGNTGGPGTAAKSVWGDDPIGILNNQTSGSTPGIGASGIIGYQIPASVVVAGITRLRVDAAYSAGTYLSAATGTKAGIGTQNASKATSRAVALEASVAADDVIAVRLIN